MVKQWRCEFVQPIAACKMSLNFASRTAPGTSNRRQTFGLDLVERDAELQHDLTGALCHEASTLMTSPVLRDDA